jgi:hypothetical protein
MTKWLAASMLTLTFLLGVPVSASAGPSHEAPLALKILDVALVRPVGVAVSTASTLVAIGTAPLTWAMGVGEPAAILLVETPWKFTSARYVGHFDEYRGEGLRACADGQNLHPSCAPDVRFPEY